MKEKIMPITALRDTVKLDEEINKNKAPIIITKNGFGDFVILPIDMYENHPPRFPEGPHHPPMMPFPKLHEEECPQDNPLGFVRVGCGAMKVEVGNVKVNVASIKKVVLDAIDHNVHVLVSQELGLTGYTAGDLFNNEAMLAKVEKGLKELELFSKGKNIVFAVGAPLAKDNSLYNCGILIYDGKILGVTPKTHLPEYSEFYERRYFQEAPRENNFISIDGSLYPFGSKIIYVNKPYNKLKIALEICEDGWMPDSPSVYASLNGATLVLNLSASNEVVGKANYRRSLVASNSAKCLCAYAYASAGEGESTSDMVYAGHNIIGENGKILAESKLFNNKSIYADIDIDILTHERVKTTSFNNRHQKDIIYIPFDLKIKKPEEILRFYAKNPFIPSGEEIDLNRVQEIIKMQSMGLANRLQAIHCQKAVLGLSGGLDSTLAFFIIVEAFKHLGYDPKGIIAITMPCFGTSKRTHDNAIKLAESFNATLLEINISESVKQHLKDIGHDELSENLAYENAQARERTQVLMDYANDHGAIVVGTGDLSELCLGWCTYNGDHMSMYGVNASIPKTLVKYLCKGYAIMHPEAQECILDILDTPISPELLSNKEGELSQKTEDLIGPYELHDFFIYHFLRFGSSPTKIYEIAKQTFKGEYDNATIKKWLREFFRRFFTNQFKRNCLPDGAKVGTVAISPRGDLRLPSDINGKEFLEEIDLLD